MINCPTCKNELSQTDGGAHCNLCDKEVHLEALCPDCHKPLQVLKACGAVDYFCQNGHGLISKKRVEFVPAAR
ncbi:zinc ribbon domain-containing protein [Cedecea neteri]|uniref:zinc ribbon domain-containing protein n=1 Tax=Cedecea neteri TaxID=158822 RepID=UPI002AA717DC|nr:zinc ribbon domain-containing protein [Cedecea neteri]WPU24132.1 zinc ribbon domain-containing protein [Cedecea neteri]